MMDKVKVLWVSLNAPTLRSDRAGGNTFNYYFKYFYKDERFDVKVIAQINNDLPLMEVKEGDCFYLKRGSNLKDKLKRLSSLESKYNPWNRNANLISNQMENFVKRNILLLLERGYHPDIVILEWTQCVVMARMIRRLLPHAFIVASEHDVTYVGYKRQMEYYTGFKKIIWKVKYKNEKNIEITSLKTCDLVLPHNPDNVDLLLDENISRECVQWLAPYFNNMCRIERHSNYRDILFFGAMSRPENYLSAIWFIENVMPLLADEDIRFVVVGGNPPEQLKRYENDKIRITGFVESIEPYFEQSMCLVAPLVLGAGIKVKILEALSSGIPVITNDIGIEGIPAPKGVSYVYCQKPEDYVTAIRNALKGELDEIGRNGRRFIQSNYDIEKSVSEYMKKLLAAKEVHKCKY